MSFERPTGIVQSIRREIQRLAGTLDQIGRSQLSGVPDRTDEIVEIARKHLRLRRRRDTVFPHELFGEAAWDILLDLFVSEADGRTISVSSACVAAAVPQTTALRHIGVMEKAGLVERRAHPRDGRQVVVLLTPAAREMLTRCLVGELRH